MEIQTHELSNGICIIHQHIKSAVAHCGIMINTGSRDETALEQGMSHFIEHALFKETKKRKAFHILSRMEDVGGELNAYTTSYLTLHCPKKSLKKKKMSLWTRFIPISTAHQKPYSMIMKN